MEQAVFWAGLTVVVLTYMSLWYAVARWAKRYDVIDTAWGLGFVIIAWVSLGIRANFGIVQVVSALLVSVWGLRLSAHIAQRNWRKSEDDQRYQALAAKWADGAALKFYTNVFLLQGVLLIAVSTPMIATAFAGVSANPMTYAGWIVWLFGIIFEATADGQLATFIARRKPGSHELMSSGLWRYSRHPNYFGEVTTWWGAAFAAASVGGWWGVLGAITITVLITKVSGIPLLEKRYKNNKAYQDYRARTSVLIPLPPKTHQT